MQEFKLIFNFQKTNSIKINLIQRIILSNNNLLLWKNIKKAIKPSLKFNFLKFFKGKIKLLNNRFFIKILCKFIAINFRNLIQQSF